MQRALLESHVSFDRPQLASAESKLPSLPSKEANWRSSSVSTSVTAASFAKSSPEEHQAASSAQSRPPRTQSAFKTPQSYPPLPAIASPLDKTRASPSTLTPLSEEQLLAITRYDEHRELQDWFTKMGHDSSAFYYYPHLPKVFNELVQLVSTLPPTTHNPVPKLIRQLRADKVRPVRFTGHPQAPLYKTPETHASLPSSPLLPKLPSPTAKLRKQATSEQQKAIVSYEKDKNMQKVLLEMGYDASSFYPHLECAFNELELSETPNVPDFLNVAAICEKRKVDANKLLAHNGHALTSRPPPPGPAPKALPNSMTSCKSEAEATANTSTSLLSAGAKAEHSSIHPPPTAPSSKGANDELIREIKQGGFKLKKVVHAPKAMNGTNLPELYF